MEFGKHIGKGAWGFADKSLPAIYGIAYIFLVVRVLPEQEFGAWGIVQALFLLLSSLCYALAFQPLTKFAAEHKEYGQFLSASLALGIIFCSVVSAGLFFSKDTLIPLLDPEKTANLYELWNYVPLMLFATLFRTMVVSLLQVQYAVKKIFWIDAVYFIGTIVMIMVAQHLQHFSTANDLVILNLIGLSLSSALSLFFLYRALPEKLSFRWADVVTMLNFGKYIFGGNALYIVFSQIDVFFVSAYTGVAGVATYNVAKIFIRVFDMLSQVLQMFLLPFSSKMFAEKEMKKLLDTAEKAICFSSLLLLPVIVAMLVFPEKILLVLYQGRYLDAAPLMRIFSALALIIPWNGVFSTYLIGFGKVKQAFFLALLLPIIAIPLYGFLTSYLGVIGASISYVVSMLFLTIILNFIMKQYIEVNPLNVIARVKDVWGFVRKRMK